MPKDRKDPTAAKDMTRPRVGVSTCLLGVNVRYNGGHARDRFLTDTFGQFVEWVPVCPEVECGLPVPREAMRLVGDPASPQLVTIDTKINHTRRMQSWARKRVRELESESLVGFIFKSRSPSSGRERVKVYDAKGVPHRVGVGLWAREFMDHFPLLPVEEEGRLHDPAHRENFIERIFCLKRYRDTIGSRRSRGALVRFHAAHRLQLMVHSRKILKEMGQLVAHAKEVSLGDLFQRYEELLTAALALKSTPGKNADVLRHGLGYFKRQLTADEKKEALEVIDEYRAGCTLLIVPITFVSHLVRKYGEPNLASQTYLNPHPIELKLRNHA